VVNHSYCKDFVKEILWGVILSGRLVVEPTVSVTKTDEASSERQCRKDEDKNEKKLSYIDFHSLILTQT